MNANSRLNKLVDLAQERDSARRRELLREVTDLFFETRGARSETADGLFGDVLKAVAADMQDSVLVELADRFSDAPDAPIALMRDLANRSFEIAEPILRRSPVLKEADLIEIVQHRSQSHIRAVAARPELAEPVSEAIVRFGDDDALGTLIRNDGAKISRASMEQAVDRARRNVDLHEGVIARSDMPLDLVNEMYFLVETRLRTQILQRNAGVDPAALDAALAKARERIRRVAGDVSEDMRKASAFIRVRKAAGELDGKFLIALYRDKQISRFLCGLAELTGLDVETARLILERKDFDALAMICRASDMERPLFVTIALLTCGGEGDAMARGEEFGRLYSAIPIDAAQRAMRFYKTRKSAGDAAAA